MSYVAYESGGRHHVGEVHEDQAVPLSGVSRIDATTPAGALHSADRLWNEAVQIADVRVLPVSEPRRIVCVGLNYDDHVNETGRDRPEYPVLFAKFATSLIGAADDIVLPPEAEFPDFEGELAVVIGTAGRRVHEDHAAGHILGYSVANDVTMRDYQYKTHQWLQGKAWDATTPVGPFVVTPDEVDIDDCGIRTVLNDEVMQESHLSQFIFPIPRLISLVSTFTTLEPGDIILTGTPGGVGYRREPPVRLRPGDRIRVEVDGVGMITNRVTSED